MIETDGNTTERSLQLEFKGAPLRVSLNFRGVGSNQNLLQIRRSVQKQWNDFSVCDGNHFKCWDGACAWGLVVCDGRKDCDDNSDETLPECFTVQGDENLQDFFMIPLGFLTDYA